MRVQQPQQLQLRHQRSDGIIRILPRKVRVVFVGRVWVKTMTDYILLMHDDAVTGELGEWGAYLQTLERRGVFEGGSAIGDGVCMRKAGTAPGTTSHLTGYIRITVGSLEDAKSPLAGNPHFEAGGTVEIRELPRTVAQN
jgi:hypothetical protein